jgi:hypothetical protein
VLSSEQLAEIGHFKVVILPDVKLMSDATARALREYVAGGGRLLVVGAAGALDERGRIRRELALADVTGVSAFREHEGVFRNGFGKGKAVRFNRPGDTGVRIPDMFPQSRLAHPRWSTLKDEWLRELRDLMQDGSQVRVEGQGVLGMSLSRSGDGKTVVQAVAYDDEPVEQQLTFSLRPDVADEAAGQWLAAPGAAVPVEGEEREGRCVFAAPGFVRYGALVLG